MVILKVVRNYILHLRHIHYDDRFLLVNHTVSCEVRDERRRINTPFGIFGRCILQELTCLGWRCRVNPDNQSRELLTRWVISNTT